MRLILILFATLWATTAAVVPPTSKVTLAWDAPVPVTGVTGYFLHWGTSPFSHTASVHCGTNTQWTLTNMTIGVTYYFRATAHDAAFLESDYSNEVEYKIPPPTQPTTQRITFQMQESTHPVSNFVDIAGAIVTITNAYNALVPGYFYKAKIDAQPIP